MIPLEKNAADVILRQFFIIYKEGHFNEKVQSGISE